MSNLFQELKRRKVVRVADPAEKRAAGGAVGVAEREIQHDLAASRHPQGGAVVTASVDIGVDAGCHPREAERVETLNFSVLGNHVRAPLDQILRSP
jgi:hypothetical protein